MYFQTVKTVLSLLMLASGGVSTNCESQIFTTYTDKVVHRIDLNTAEKCDPIDCNSYHTPTKTDISAFPECKSIETDATSESHLPRQAPSASDTLTTGGSDESTSSSSYSPVVVTAISIETVTSPNIVFVTSTASVAEGPNIGPLTYPTSIPAASPFPSKETSTSSHVEARSSESASVPTATASNAAGTLTRPRIAVAGLALGAVALF